MKTPSPSSARAFALLAVLAAASPASGQGISLRVAPEASVMQWGEGTGLEDATFLGGGLSLGFGRYVTLKGSYRRAGTLETNFADAGYRPFDSSLMENRVTTSLFSGGVLFRLGGGPFAPVLSASGGVLDLEPEGRDRVHQIQVAYGGGVDLRLTPWLDGQIVLEQVRLRLDRSLLTGADAIPATDPDRGVTRSGVGVTASFGMRTGASRVSDRADDVDQGFGRLLSGNFDGLMVPLEAQAGVMRFDDALGLPDQATVGMRAGLDFGPYFGVRGQYWHGVTNGFGGFQGVAGWTGEVQFNVGRVTGTSPYLLLGYGQTRFNDDFRSDVGVAVEDQNALVVGVGAGIPLGDRARLTFTLRDFITTSGTLEQASSTGDLRHSFGLSGGISVMVAGRRTPAPVPSPLPVVPGPAGAGTISATIVGDSADFRSGQIIAIPVPREGEIYLRYGPARTLPDSVGAPPPATDTTTAAARAALGLPAESSAVEDLRRQVDELTRLVRESLGLQAAGLVLRPGVTVVTGEGAPAPAPPEPFLRAVEGRVGRTSVDGHGGLGIGAEAYFRSLQRENRLLPFLGLELARSDVETTWRGAPVRGTLTTVGTDFGVTAVLPGLGPFWPTASAFLTAVSGRTSGAGSADEGPMDRLYGGLSAGAGFAVGGAYRPNPDGRTLITTALRRAWAGGKSRWNVQVGARLVLDDLLGAPRTGPFSVQSSRDYAPPAGAPVVGAPGVVAPAPGDEPAARDITPSDPAQLLARLEALEAQVRQATEQREAALAEARAQQARADSLTAVTEAAAAAEDRERERATRERGALLAELRGLAAASGYVVSVAESDAGIRIVLGGDLFPVGATEVGPAARAEIGRVAAVLAPVEGLTATVDGHTDSTGSAEANRTISRLRAEAVRGALMSGGLSADAVTASGSGQESPVADNATRAGRALNRRVEVLVRLPPDP